jgi:hypothetical protein
MLDDALWETAYSGYNHEDYYAIAEASVSDPVKYGDLMRREKRDIFFYPLNHGMKPSLKPLTDSFVRDVSSTGRFYANAVQMDDYMNNSTVVPNADFSIISTLGFVDSMENSFEESKGFTNFYNALQNTALRMPTNFMPVQSYIQVFNAFRSDFEEFGPCFNASDSSSQADITSVNDAASYDNDQTRFTSSLRLRRTARNSIVTYNALQKVFRSRLEEGRSNYGLNQLAELESKQPFITANRPSYQKMLGKNRESFYSTTTYKTGTLGFLNDLHSLNSSLNFYFFD